MDLALLVAAALATVLASGLGAVPLFLLGDRVARWSAGLWGLASGVMLVAAVAGLLLPALDRGRPGTVALGLVAGVAFLLGVRIAVGHRPRAAHVAGAETRSTWVVLIVLLVHSLPEGLAIGTAYASGDTGLGVLVIVAIALQNVPEGTAAAIGLAADGASRSRQFWGAVLTSMPQPFGAVVAYLLVDVVDGLLAPSFAFAAGAMLALVALETGPTALRGPHRREGLAGVAAGGAVMLALALLLGA